LLINLEDSGRTGGVLKGGHLLVDPQVVQHSSPEQKNKKE
jgi:hypothetical protein